MTPLTAARESDLRRAADESGEVLENIALDGGMVELTVRLPHLARNARPGEFAQLRCGPGMVPLLRRPMSVAWVEGEAVSFVFEPVGVGTRLLAALRPGDRLDVLGPLGLGFTIPAGAWHVVCVSGGLGCAPFPLVARAAIKAGAARVTVLNGAATAARLYDPLLFARGEARVEVIEATDDGSRGHHGSVVDLLPPAVAGGVDAVFACGPNPMLVALAAALDSLPARPPVCEVSLEAPMGCGFGTCLGCALPVLDSGAPWALCCRQGPVMPVEAVDWAGLRALPPAHVA